MSMPVFSNMLSFSARRNRRSFMLAALAIFVAHAAAGLGLNIAGGGAVAAGIVVLLIIIPGHILLFILSAQRFRDMGLTGWLALLWLPAIVVGFRFLEIQAAINLACVILLSSMPGTKGENRYGSDPLEDS